MNLLKEKIIINPDEEEKDVLVYKLVVDEKVVCGARTQLYSHLMSITTTLGEQRKGYGRKLLSCIEEVAKQNGVRTMTTSDIDSRDFAAVSFFKSMGYKLKQLEDDEEFLEGRKILVVASEGEARILDPKLAALAYLSGFMDIGVKEKYLRTSLKCIAEACGLPIPKTDRILEYLRKKKLVERSYRRFAPPEDVFFQITKKGIKFLCEKDREHIC